MVINLQFPLSKYPKELLLLQADHHQRWLFLEHIHLVDDNVMHICYTYRPKWHALKKIYNLQVHRTNISGTDRILFPRWPRQPIVHRKGRTGKLITYIDLGSKKCSTVTQKSSPWLNCEMSSAHCLTRQIVVFLQSVDKKYPIPVPTWEGNNQEEDLTPLTYTSSALSKLSLCFVCTFSAWLCRHEKYVQRLPLQENKDNSSETSET